MLAGDRSRPYFFARVRLPTGSPEEMNSVTAAYKMLLARWCSSFIEALSSDLVRPGARRQSPRPAKRKGPWLGGGRAWSEVGGMRPNATAPEATRQKYVLVDRASRPAG